MKELGRVVQDLEETISANINYFKVLGLNAFLYLTHN